MDILGNTFWNIFKISERLLQHCNKHNIVIWPEFGTLIGHMRHHNVIPWDYDGDFGIFIEDKARLVKTYNEEFDDDIIMDTIYYKDHGCLAMHPKGNINDIVDIVFYNLTEEFVDSCMHEDTKKEYPSKTDYKYKNSDFYPLKEDIFLGYRVHIFNNVNKILEEEYGNWRAFYPEKWNILSKDKVCSSPFVQMTSYYQDMTETKMLDLVRTCTEPFIIRKTNILNISQLDFEKLIQTQKSNIFGYTSSTTWEKIHRPAVDVYDDFCNQKMNINILDSPIDDWSLFSSELIEHGKRFGQDKIYTFCWILTNAPKTTHFHIDPQIAGGYMKLLDGKKIWWCISKYDLSYLNSKGHTIENIAEYNIYDLLRLENYYLWGKIIVTLMNKGDLLWFPEKTLHKVFTIQNGYGIGGYF